MRLGTSPRPDLERELDAAGEEDRRAGRIDDDELERIARVVRRMRGTDGPDAEAASRLEVLGRLTANLPADRPAPLGGERGPFPGLRRRLKHWVRGAVRARTGPALERQREVNLAMHAIAEGMLADRDEGRR